MLRWLRVVFRLAGSLESPRRTTTFAHREPSVGQQAPIFPMRLTRKRLLSRGIAGLPRGKEALSSPQSPSSRPTARRQNLCRRLDRTPPPGAAPPARYSSRCAAELRGGGPGDAVLYAQLGQEGPAGLRNPCAGMGCGNRGGRSFWSTEPRFFPVRGVSAQRFSGSLLDIAELSKIRLW